MGCYQRNLRKGKRWYFKGQYCRLAYFSRAIYLTKQEAKKAERDKLKELDEFARNPRKASDPTLFTITEKRLDFIKLNKSKFYYTENRRFFRKAIQMWGKDTPVSQITREDINNLLMAEAKRLKDQSKSNHKVNALIRSLKALFNWAIDTYDLDIKNPVKAKFYPIDIHLKYIPTDEEIEAVKNQCNAQQKFLIDFVEQSGSRIMEAIRLKASDVDGDLITLWTRKSKNSNLTPRRIPIPDCLKDLNLDGQDRIFSEWAAYPRFLEEKTDGKWNWHNLRHRRASLWAKENKTLLEIMHLLGHSNLATTQRYLQLLGFTRL